MQVPVRRAIQPCAAFRGARPCRGCRWQAGGQCSQLWSFRWLPMVRQAGARTQSPRFPSFWLYTTLNYVGVSSGCSTHRKNCWIGWSQLRHPKLESTTDIWPFPASVSPSVKWEPASHLRNLVGSKWSDHKPDSVTLAVSFASPHSPVDVSAADATTGLGKVLLNVRVFRF